MTDDEVLARVREIFQDLFEMPAADITPVTSQHSVEAWDSLQHLNVVLALEQAFAVEFAPEEMEQLVSVGAILLALKSKLRAHGTAG